MSDLEGRAPLGGVYPEGHTQAGGRRSASQAPLAADPAEQVAYAARLIAHAGLVEAFGHVSTRRPEGGFLLTSSAPLLAAKAKDVLHLDLAGRVMGGEKSLCPPEAPLHAAIYSACHDVGAICRTHSPAAEVWASRGEVPPLVHGLGGLSGVVTFHHEPQLVTSMEAGRAAAGDLGAYDCLLLHANGAVCTAPELSQAVVRAWFLEERSRVAEHARRARALTDSEAVLRARHYEAEEQHAWEWLKLRFGADN
ncbi:MAG TPA: class II aldolase/adducin family protein [Solirubrobacteraceae bacterium]|nr:class II aldolase/adducin family protein [Solirubrobacteraceae bacterium]